MANWLKFRIIRKSKLDKLKEQHRQDNKVIANLMDMNHQLVQIYNRIPAKYKKGMTVKVKNGK